MRRTWVVLWSAASTTRSRARQSRLTVVRLKPGPSSMVASWPKPTRATLSGGNEPKNVNRSKSAPQPPLTW